jgi:hypothetical protein
MLKAFHITSGKGFQVTFANGYTVSVQFGAGNYCDNRHAPTGSTTAQYQSTQRLCGEMGSGDAEIGVFNGDGFTYLNGIDVEGWASPERVAEVMAKVAAWEPNSQPVHSGRTKREEE